MDSSDVKVPTFGFDAFIPPEMAERAEKIGVQKAAMGWRTMIALGVLAGGFISMGAVFSTTVTAGTTGHLFSGKPLEKLYQIFPVLRGQILSSQTCCRLPLEIF